MGSKKHIGGSKSILERILCERRAALAALSGPKKPQKPAKGAPEVPQRCPEGGSETTKFDPKPVENML